MPEHLSTASNMTPEPNSPGLVNAFEIGAADQFLTAEAPTRILISFTVNSADFGFESVYQELSAISSSIDRVRHVKGILFNAHAGKARGISAHRGLMPTCQYSFKIAFPVTRRDVGLSWLFDQLLLLGSTFERNQHVRRLLYQACTEPLVQVKPAPSTAPIIESTSEKNVEDGPPSVRSLTTPRAIKPLAELTEEQLAERNAMRAKKHKQNTQNYE